MDRLISKESPAVSNCPKELLLSGNIDYAKGISILILEGYGYCIIGKGAHIVHSAVNGIHHPTPKAISTFSAFFSIPAVEGEIGPYFIIDQLLNFLVCHCDKVIGGLLLP